MAAYNGMSQGQLRMAYNRMGQGQLRNLFKTRGLIIYGTVDELRNRLWADDAFGSIDCFHFDVGIQVSSSQGGQKSSRSQSLGYLFRSKTGCITTVQGDDDCSSDAYQDGLFLFPSKETPFA